MPADWPVIKNILVKDFKFGKVCSKLERDVTFYYIGTGIQLQMAVRDIYKFNGIIESNKTLL